MGPKYFKEFNSYTVATRGSSISHLFQAIKYFNFRKDPFTTLSLLLWYAKNTSVFRDQIFFFPDMFTPLTFFLYNLQWTYYLPCFQILFILVKCMSLILSTQITVSIVLKNKYHMWFMVLQGINSKSQILEIKSFFSDRTSINCCHTYKSTVKRSLLKFTGVVLLSVLFLY